MIFKTKPQPSQGSKLGLSAVWLLLFCLLPGALKAAAPVNDNFENALSLSTLPVETTGSNMEATIQPGESDESGEFGGPSVWWKWTAPTGGWVEINTFRSNFDTQLAVYTGTALDNLLLVAWNDQSGGDQSRVKFEAVSGRVYHLQVRGWLDSEGDVVLTVKPTAAPVPLNLRSLTLTPETVDVTRGPVTVTAQVTFVAGESLSNVRLRFAGPNGGDQFEVFATAAKQFERVTGSLQDGVYQFPVRIPAHRIGGIWEISAVLRDEVGTESVYGTFDSPRLPAGSTTSVTLTNSGPVDATPPQILGATVSPNTVDVTSGSRNATLRVTAQDDLAVQQLHVSFLAPASSQRTTLALAASDLVSGNVKSGVWEKTFVIPANATPGSWSISYSLIDESDRDAVYDTMNEPTPEAVPVALNVQNSGLVDATGPLLTGISTDEAVVDITNAPQTVQVSAALEDAPGGLKSATVTLSSVDGQTAIQTPLFYQDEAPWQTGLIRSASVALPRYLSPGDYQWTLTAQDSFGNESVYGPSGESFPGNFGGVLTVVNNGAVDAAPPQLASLLLSGSSVPVSSLPASVTVTLTASDDTGIAEAGIVLTTAAGATVQSVPIQLTSGTQQNGTWSGTLNLPDTLLPGSYSVGVGFVDFSGKSISYGWESGGALPIPAGSDRTLTVTAPAVEAYETWRAARPSLAGEAGLPGADPDGDGLTNALEFLCGTDPSLNSRAGGPDPASDRAPVFTFTGTHLRVDYRLSAANAALGSGNPLFLEPQSSLNLSQSWSRLVPAPAEDDRWSAQVPLSAGQHQFLRLAVIP